MNGWLPLLYAEDRGQDLIEYALLTSFIGFACIAVFDTMRNAIAFVYGSWNTAANNNWYPPNPQ